MNRSKHHNTRRHQFRMSNKSLLAATKWARIERVKNRRDLTLKEKYDEIERIKNE